jgi:predicted DNA-binding protein
MATSHRVNVNFSESAYETLDELARRRGKTMSEVLRDAISLEKWFEDTRSEGGRVLIERDGEAREIIPR